MANAEKWLNTSDDYLSNLGVGPANHDRRPFVWLGTKASVPSCSVSDAPTRNSVMTVSFLDLLDIEPNVCHRHSLAEPFLQLAL